jgi:hypothetical protein
LPLPPLTPMVTDNDCAVVMLDEPGVTVTAGVIGAATAQPVPRFNTADCAADWPLAS